MTSLEIFTLALHFIGKHFRIIQPSVVLNSTVNLRLAGSVSVLNILRVHVIFFFFLDAGEVKKQANTQKTPHNTKDHRSVLYPHSHSERSALILAFLQKQSDFLIDVF